MALAVDRNNDLAVVRVEGDVGRLPPPLLVASAGELIETQKLYVFGFPLGTQLGKNITVSETSVSSLRRDEGRTLTRIQVNGGMHFGNSGGPVTDTRGVVVGVSVSIVQGTQLHFAIPGDFVNKVLDGKFADVSLGMAYRTADVSKVPVTMTCLDPLGRVRQVQVERWTGAAATGPSSAQVIPGDGPRTAFSASYKNGRYLVDVPLPAVEPGKVCWLQPMLVNAAGGKEWGTAIRVGELTVVERKAVLLQFKPPAAPSERTLKMKNLFTFSVYQGTQRVSEVIEKMDGNMLESLKPDPRGIGTFTRLTLGSCPLTRDANGKLFRSTSQAEVLLSRFSPTFLVDADHTCQERGNRNFKTVPPLLRDLVESMYETVCNSFEATTLPLPNRTVDPLESWPARLPLFMLIQGKRKLQDIHLTCTYEGLHAVDGRNEAFITLSGVVKSRGPSADFVLGMATGHARLDLDKGFLTFVKIAVQGEVESEGAGVRILINDESSLSRAEGNSLGIAPASRNQP